MTEPYRRVIVEFAIDDKRLGRHVYHDSRSRAFQVKPRAALAEDGDATSFVPITSPAPQPTPTPTPGNAVDMALVAAGNAWEKTIFSHLTKAGKLRVAFDAWKTANGYR